MLSIPYLLPSIKDKDIEFRKYSNLLIALLARRQKKSQVGSFPIDIVVDPSTVCQLSCPYCATGNGTIKRHKGFLDPQSYASYLKGMDEHLFVVWYFSTGEPLLNKNLSEIISMSNNNEIYSVISTNLSIRLSDEHIDSLLASGVDLISVSIDGVTPKSYNRYRVKGDFHLVMDNLRKLIERKKILKLEDSPDIQWRFLLFKHNEDEIDQARSMASSIGVDLMEFFYGNAPISASAEAIQASQKPLSGPHFSGPSLERALKRSDSLLRQLLNGKIYPEPSFPHGLNSKKCDWLYLGTTLFPDGRVSPCCVSNDEPDDFGIISDASKFTGIWNNLQYKKARAWFAKEVPSTIDLVCGRCHHNSRDYQFRDTLRGLMLNAPNWFLHIVAKDPDSFFYDVDYYISPFQIGILKIPTFAQLVAGDYEDIRNSFVDLQRSAKDPKDIAKILKLLDGKGNEN